MSMPVSMPTPMSVPDRPPVIAVETHGDDQW
jgi:hypothetical protein